MSKRKKKILKIVGLIVVVIGILFGATIYSSYKGQQSRQFTGDLNSEVNKVRTAQGLTELTQDDVLNEVATKKCEDMIALNYFDHPDPSGKWVWDKWQFLKPEDYGGENLAKGTYSAEETVKSWVDSPSHYKNLVKLEFKEVGYSVCKEDGGLFYKVVQLLKS